MIPSLKETSPDDADDGKDDNDDAVVHLFSGSSICIPAVETACATLHSVSQV